MGLALTVLGGSPAWPNHGQAASGYLVESARSRVLLDCGSGIASELRAHDPGPLTDIVISHFHADHWFDLVPLHYAYRYGSWSDRPRASLHLPPGGRSVLDRVAAVWDGSVETFEAGDAADLLRAIERARRRNPGRHAAARLVEQHSWDAALSQELADLEALVARVDDPSNRRCLGAQL